MRRAARMVQAVLKMAFGTDERCELEDVMKETSGPQHSHETVSRASSTEKNIERMNAATDRLARLRPAANLHEALEQLTQIER